MFVDDPEVSVVVISYNSRVMTLDCLHALHVDLTGVAADIWLVDNASSDGSVEAIQAEYPKVNIIANKHNIGFGAANNQAFERAKGEYFLLINTDAFLTPGAIHTMLACLKAHPDAAVVGPRLHNRDGSLQRSCYRFPGPLRCVCENLLLTAAFPNNPFLGDYRGWAHDSERYVDFVIGAALLVRRTVVEQIGGFDTDFFMYAEEADWQLRMHAAGWKALFCPQAQLIHYGGESSSASMKDRQFCEFNRASARFMRKHYGLYGWCVQRAAMVTGAGIRLTLWSLLYITGGARRQKAVKNIADWSRLLRWWAGGGPYIGLAETENH